MLVQHLQRCQLSGLASRVLLLSRRQVLFQLVGKSLSPSSSSYLFRHRSLSQFKLRQLSHRHYGLECDFLCQIPSQWGFSHLVQPLKLLGLVHVMKFELKRYGHHCELEYGYPFQIPNRWGSFHPIQLLKLLRLALMISYACLI